MIVDGKKLAEEIKSSLKKKILALDKKPRLAIVKVGNNLVTEKFLKQKTKFASDIGAEIRIYEFPENISTSKLRKEVSKIIHIKENSGIIVQLPLPKHINADYIADTLPVNKDPDLLSSKSAGLLLSGRSKILPPVVGAVKSIFTAYGVKLTAKHAVVVGSGKLVGKPIAIWLINNGATVTLLNSKSENIEHYLSVADIIVSGVGKPKIISPDLVKNGVAAIDCGTSESEGALLGDIDTAVADKASIFTPVPGGVGPLTVAMLFSNLVELGKIK